MRERLQRLSFLLSWALAAYFGARLARGSHAAFALPLAFFAAMGVLWRLGRLGPRLRLHLVHAGVLLVLIDLMRRQVDGPRLWAALREADPAWILPAMLGMVGSLLIRAWRWRWMLITHHPGVRLGSLMGALSVGLAANLIIPARVGEFLRAVYLKRRDGIPLAAGFSSVLMERLLDSVVLLGFLGLGIVVLGLKNPEARLAMRLGLPLALAVLWLVFYGVRHQERVIGWVHRRLPERTALTVTEAMGSFLSGLHFLRDPRLGWRIALGSALGWGVALATVQFTLRAFHFPVEFPWVTSFLVLAMLAIGLAVPVTPGGVGVFQAAAMLAIALASGKELAELGPERALAFGVLLQINQAVPILLLAGWYFFFNGVDVKTIAQESRDRSEPIESVHR